MVLGQFRIGHNNACQRNLVRYILVLLHIRYVRSKQVQPDVVYKQFVVEKKKKTKSVKAVLIKEVANMVVSKS